MASIPLINIQFSQARQKAKELNETAAEIKNMANGQYENTINNISANWKSDSASAYIGKAEKLKADMIKSAVQLEKIASNILQSVAKMEEAERRAQEIAKIRAFK